MYFINSCANDTWYRRVVSFRLRLEVMHVFPEEARFVSLLPYVPAGAELGWYAREQRWCGAARNAWSLIDSGVAEDFFEWPLFFFFNRIVQ